MAVPSNTSFFGGGYTFSYFLLALYWMDIQNRSSGVVKHYNWHIRFIFIVRLDDFVTSLFVKAGDYDRKYSCQFMEMKLCRYLSRVS